MSTTSITAAISTPVDSFALTTLRASRRFAVLAAAVAASALALGCETGGRGGDAPARDARMNDRDGGTDRVRVGRNARNDRNDRAAAGMVRHSLAYPTGERETSVVMMEVDAPKQVRLGQPYQYTMRVTNLTDTPLHGVEVRDVPASANGPTTGPATRSAMGAATGAMNNADRAADRNDDARNDDSRDDDARDGGRVAWNVGSIGPNQTREQTMTATADEKGTMSNCLSVRYDPTLCVAVQVVEPALQIVKAGPELASICEEIPYTYTVTNTGTGVARGVRVVDTLPQGLASADGGRGVDLNVGDLNQGQSKKVTARLKANQVGRFASRATARSSDLEAQSREVVTTVRQPVLAVNVEAPEARYVGEAVDYRVTVRNTGDAPAEKTVVRFDSASGQNPANRTLPTIAPGGEQTFTISQRAGRQAGDLRLTATAEATCAKPATGNAAVAIRTVPALQLECVDGEDPIRVNGQTTYTINVRNEGSGPDTNVVLKGQLPEQLQFVSAGANNPSQITANGRDITFGPVANLPAGNVLSWVMTVKAVAPGDAQFRVELTAASLEKPAVEDEPTKVLTNDAR